jgi:proteasome beta subunit
VGRIFTYDVAGGRYEEADHHATGSGGRDARTTIKLGYREGLRRTEAVDLAILSLYEAADEDAATGGPDVIRGIYPTVATVTAVGFERVPVEDVAERFQALIEERSARGDER